VYFMTQLPMFMFHHTFKSLAAGWLLALSILSALPAGKASAQWGDLRVKFLGEGEPERAIVVPASQARPKCRTRALWWIRLAILRTWLFG
jgi:hypothetical protein